MAKFFGLYEGPYIVPSIAKNRATIYHVQTGDESIENLQNLRLYRCSPEKYDQLRKEIDST